jgi:hypothetical protein
MGTAGVHCRPVFPVPLPPPAGPFTRGKEGGWQGRGPASPPARRGPPPTWISILNALATDKNCSFPHHGQGAGCGKKPISNPDQYEISEN